MVNVEVQVELAAPTALEEPARKVALLVENQACPEREDGMSARELVCVTQHPSIKCDFGAADLLTMARLFGGCPPAADNLPAFQAAMSEELQTAQAELDRLAAPHKRVLGA